MTPKHPSCRAIETDLVATATGDASAAAARRVDDHARSCAPCREELGRYRAIDSVARGLRHDAPPAADVAASRSALQARLADLKSRVLMYGIVPTFVTVTVTPGSTASPWWSISARRPRWRARGSAS